MRYIEFQ